MSWLFFLATLITVFSLAFVRAGRWAWTVGLVLLAVAGILQPGVSWVLLTIYLLLTIPALAVLNLTTLRRMFVTKHIFAWFQQVLPPVSETEKEAIDAGTVWWDAELFSGKPNWGRLFSIPQPELNEREQAFIDGPVKQLCDKLNAWEIQQANDLPPAVWQQIREDGFLGLIIPEQYGGKGFSAQANSEIVMRIASRSQTAAVTVMVPNSLGPGELLMHFGTDEQKDHYLPRLASGEEIPCFALTGPYAGSDASAMPDTGIVCKQQVNGEEVLGLKVSWNKRYITLAPVATVLGLAFRAYDPDGLLGDKEELGITCALVPTDTPGVEIGKRHLPSGEHFMNGPTSGEDVFIPMDYVIGGQERIGQGWRMLMYCLAAGRAISLPAQGTIGAKLALATTSAYARVRKQFKIPIGRFEGIAEVLARMAASTYRMDATRSMTLVALDQGEKPVVLSAVLKYNLTEGYRDAVIDAMDVHAGKGIIEGPNNYLASIYQSLPISITVEGANILTRSLIIFGQGAIRCHPYLLKEMQAAQIRDPDSALIAFDKALFAHIGFLFSNVVRTFLLGLSGGWLAKSPVSGKLANSYRQLARMSAAFALTSDLTLLILGGKFKFKESLSGRFADILSHLYMISAMLKRHRDRGNPVDETIILKWAIADSMTTIQMRLEAVLKNFPIQWMGSTLRRLIFPFGRAYAPASDRLSNHIADTLLQNAPLRNALIRGVHFNADSDHPVDVLERAFVAALKAKAAETALGNAFKTTVTPLNAAELVTKGIDAGVITDTQGDDVLRAQELAAKVIAVDSFPGPDADHATKNELTTQEAQTAA